MSPYDPIRPKSAAREDPHAKEPSRGFWRAFSPNSRSRGRSYWSSGLVSTIERKRGRVEARVVGGVPYDVVLELTEEGALSMGCTCPAFRVERECKHAFAVLLEMEARGWLHEPDETELTPLEREEEERREFEQRVSGLRVSGELNTPPVLAAWTGRDLELGFAVVEQDLGSTGQVHVEALGRRPRPDGGMGSWKPLTDAERRYAGASLDREILGWIHRGDAEESWSAGARSASSGSRSRALDEATLRVLAPLLQASHHVMRRESDGALLPLRVSLDPWRFEARVLEQNGRQELVGELVRGAERRALASPLGAAAAPWRARRGRTGRGGLGGAPPVPASDGPRLIARAGWLLFEDELAPIDWGSARELALELCQGGPLPLPAQDVTGALVQLAAHAGGRLVGELDQHTERVAPLPALFLFTPPGAPTQGREWLHARVEFLYQNQAVPADEVGEFVQTGTGVLRRDMDFERAAGERLSDLGFRPADTKLSTHHAILHRGRLAPAAEALMAEGWRVELEGKGVAAAGEARARIRSGVDWFGVEGEVSYGGEDVELPALLASLRKGHGWVKLKDGRLGLLPGDWAKRWGWLELSQGGEPGSLRFPKQQAWLLDALLADRLDVAVDADFAKLRESLRAFDRARPLTESAGLVGELRPYQREGLGWLDALTTLGLGGCLADDMGLGKTVQVLAFLERRRSLRVESGEPHRPSLVVAPRSVLFNWIDEARRFAPQLTLSEHHGGQRWHNFEAALRSDLIVTTYATLRIDIERLRKQPLDVVVLDEAQAIKNPTSLVAKATRLLDARQRLALTGTPVENRLEDLWSLFEFLNPGMLGGAQGFTRLLGQGDGSREENLKAIARAIRPFFLRRTKAQVLAELPEKTEQTIFVELLPKQRKAYDQLAEYYRKMLLSSAEIDPLAPGNQFQVLTALLRLRQCACHEALIDPELSEAGSAKLDELLERLTEIANEGNKALVFSQFTSFLALAETRLEAAGIPYEYLDGQTRDRKERVERFQGDPTCPVFLVSLKAGGTGLNLTAADYVFLLDPWWNPAVEAQAIDRAHRIGRTRPVLAYRLVARDTIEERVLELQQSKRELVAGLFDERSGSISNLRRQDLEALLA